MTVQMVISLLKSTVYTPYICIWPTLGVEHCALSLEHMSPGQVLVSSCQGLLVLRDLPIAIES
jgi:hypothetical protein